MAPQLGLKAPEGSAASLPGWSEEAAAAAVVEEDAARRIKSSRSALSSGSLQASRGWMKAACMWQ
jgi:hypothetical protein